jgi:hypothetical protein
VLARGRDGEDDLAILKMGGRQMATRSMSPAATSERQSVATRS